MRAFSQLSDYTTGGLLPPLSYTKPGTALGGQAPRVVNTTMGLSQYQDGRFVPYDGGKFIDPFVAPQQLHRIPADAPPAAVGAGDCQTEVLTPTARPPASCFRKYARDQDIDGSPRPGHKLVLPVTVLLDTVST
jgi:hypothetical protein